MEYKLQSFGESLGIILNLYIRNIKKILLGGFIILAFSGIVFWLIHIIGQYLGITGNYIGDFLGRYNTSLPTDASYLLKALVFFATSAYSIFLLQIYNNDYKGKDRGVQFNEISPLLKRHYFPILLCNILVFLGTMGGMLLLVIPGIIFSLAWFLSECFVLLEDMRAVEAMRSSWQLTRKNRWTILGMSIVISIITWIVIFLLSKAISYALVPVQMRLSSNWRLNQWNEIILNLFISTPLQVSMTLVLYHNLKIKKEGLPSDELEKEFNKAEESAEV